MDFSVGFLWSYRDERGVVRGPATPAQTAESGDLAVKEHPKPARPQPFRPTCSHNVAEPKSQAEPRVEGLSSDRTPKMLTLAYLARRSRAKRQNPGGPLLVGFSCGSYWKV